MIRRFLSLIGSVATVVSSPIVVLLVLTAGIGSPIAIMLILLGPHIRWWGATLERHPWLFVLLALIFASHYVIGGVLYYHGRKYQQFLLSPEGKRRRTREVQDAIARIVDKARARPMVKLDEAIFEGASPAAVITEARRLAGNFVKDELRGQGIKPWEVDAKEIAKLAQAVLETDGSIVETAAANIRKRGVR